MWITWRRSQLRRVLFDSDILLGVLAQRQRFVVTSIRMQIAIAVVDVASKILLSQTRIKNPKFCVIVVAAP